jgi:hypothetical protein
MQSEPIKATDCFSCRLIGTASLGGSSLYVLYHQSQIPKGTRTFDRVGLAAFSAALASGAIWRWFTD